MEIDNLLEFGDRRQLREWLEGNHATAGHCWVAAFRSRRPDGVATGVAVFSDCVEKDRALPYLDIVEEALCFGWIDSTNKRLPDGRLAQRLSPRRKGSHWTQLNKDRCRDLEARGLMTPAGRAALSQAVLS